MVRAQAPSAVYHTAGADRVKAPTLAAWQSLYSNHNNHKYQDYL